MSRFSAAFAPFPKLALGAAAALAAITLSPGSAQAYVVTVGGVQYDVTTFTGTYNANTSKFAPPPAPGVMPWWGSSASALAFASAVGNYFGSQNGPGGGPLFAYEYDSTFNMGSGPLGAIIFAWDNGTTNILPASLSDGRVWAQATLVSPTPGCPAAARRRCRLRVQPPAEEADQAGAGSPGLRSAPGLRPAGGRFPL
jgi:hypothetical protein